jgi:Amt family ammonium transporter
MVYCFATKRPIWYYAWRIARDDSDWGWMMPHRRYSRYRWCLAPLAALALLLLCAAPAHAQTFSDADIIKGVNTVWVLIAAFLVFFMQAGFAFLEAGATAQKNTVSILMKNLIDFSVGSIAFWAVGFALMFGVSSGTAVEGWIGTTGFFLLDLPDDPTLAPLAFWLFQLVFAGTAATIVSGAMAERTKFSVYLISSIVITALIYPIFGHWVWSDAGWLANLPVADGFRDFAGSTVVHSVGGWAALTGAYLLGPRIGRFSRDDTADPEDFRGQSVPFSTLGVFILWLGWFGFNPGSQLAAVGFNADVIALVAANTNLAAAAGGLSALALVRIVKRTWKLTLTLNGVLGGLVAITAPCAFVAPGSAIVIGLVGGLVVTLGTWWLESVQIDDPVGAVPVHLFAGIWGTLAVGIFASDTGLLAGAGPGQLIAQLVGVAACAVWTGATSMLMFYLIKQISGLRVSPEIEIEGLDSAQHGETGYPVFRQSEEDTPSAKLPSFTPESGGSGGSRSGR